MRTLKNFGIIRYAAKRISKAANDTLCDFEKKLVEQENQFTDRMLGRIAQSMNNYSNKGIFWNSKTFTDKGKGSQEKEFGADFMGVLSIEIEGYSIKKGFLAQAKKIEPHSSFSKSEFNRLKDQCKKMLEITPESFVFIYSINSIIIVPAISITSSDHCNPHNLYSKKISRFFEDHFSSFIGDERINEPSVSVCNEIKDNFSIRCGLLIEAIEIDDIP